MSDHPSRQYDGLARWLGDDADDSPSTPSAATTDRERRRRRLLRRGTRAAALSAPWLIVLAVLAAPPRAPGPRALGPPARAAAPAPRTGAADRGPADATAPSAPAGTAAIATRLVRDAVTGRHAGATTAVDVAVPETPRPLGSMAWIVRVHAVVLHGDTRRWRSATHEVWAVPVGVQAGRLVGLDDPWHVGTEETRVTPGRWEATTVDEAAVRSALRTVDAHPPEDIHAEQHPAIADVIRVRVSDGKRAHHVWLRTTPDVHVLGASAAVPARDPAADPAGAARTAATERTTS